MIDDCTDARNAQAAQSKSNVALKVGRTVLEKRWLHLGSTIQFVPVVSQMIYGKVHIKLDTSPKTIPIVPPSLCDHDICHLQSHVDQHSC